MTFSRAVPLESLWEGELTSVRVDGVRVVLVRVGDLVHAYEDRCQHLGVELSHGRLEGHVLTCSAHEWTYDVVTGRGINPKSACLKRFPVEHREGVVFVDVSRPPVDRAAVGPVLELGAVADAIVQAIRRRNADVRVVDRGAYLRVGVPLRCVLRRADVEESLGRPFRLPNDLEMVMPSFKGNMTLDAEEVVWSFGGGAVQ